MKINRCIIFLLACVTVLSPWTAGAQATEPQLPELSQATSDEQTGDNPEAPVLSMSDEPADGEDTLVYIIPIRNMIEPALLYVVRRGVTEAEQRNADAIIFVMDTPGGRVDVTGDILQIIQNISVPTYTFIEKDAYSAGAIIALATRHIYMAPGSVIGAATPLVMTPSGGVQDLPDEVEEKMVSGVAAKVRAAAEQGGHDTELAEAMVRRDLEYKIGDTVISEKGELLTLTNEEAAQMVGAEGEPKHHLLSEGTVKNVDDLLKTIGLASAEKKELQITGAEKIARFIAAFAPILLMIGLAGIYIEFKTPGFGLPGMVGGMALLLFFWGHHIAGLSGMEDMIIFLAGVTLLLIEILIIPGFGFTGIAGITLIIWALISAMVQHHPGMPWYQPSWDDLSQAFVTFTLSLAGTIGIGVLVGYYLPRSRAFDRLALSQSERHEDGFAASRDLNYLVGRSGTTLCALRPAGSARFGEDRFDVVTQGEFIQQDQRVTVIEAHGSRIIVKEASTRKETKA